MTLTIYAMANEQDSLTRFIVNNEVGLVNSTNHQSSGQRGTLAYQGRSPLVLEWPTAVSEIWVSGLFGCNNNTSATDYPLVVAYSSSNVDQFAARLTNSVAMTMARNVSGTMTNQTPTIHTPDEYRVTTADAWDCMFHFKVGNPGRMAVYYSGALVFELTGDYSAMSNMKGIRIHSQSISTAQRVARLVVADAPVMYHQFDTLLPDGSGNSSDWGANGHTRLSAAGPIGLQSGLGMMNPYDPIAVNATGQKHLSTYENVGSLPANGEIYGVQLAAIGSIDSAATPTAISFLARHASTDYTLNNMGITVGDGYMSYQQFLYTNPAGGAWNSTDLNAIQFGVTT